MKDLNTQQKIAILKSWKVERLGTFDESRYTIRGNPTVSINHQQGCIEIHGEMDIEPKEDASWSHPDKNSIYRQLERALCHIIPQKWLTVEWDYGVEKERMTCTFIDRVPLIKLGAYLKGVPEK